MSARRTGGWAGTLALLLLALAPDIAVGEDDAPYVQVRDAAGRPLAAARLLTDAGTFQGRVVFDPRARTLAMSGASGHLRIPAPPADPGRRTPRWIVVADGHAPVLLPAEFTRLTVRLLAAHPSRGVIRRARGKAAAGRTVFATPSAAHAELAHRTITDEAGAYRFDALHAGRWALLLQEPRGRVRPLATVQAGDLVAPVALSSATSIRGRILDVDGVRGASVGAVPARLVPLSGGGGGEDVPFRTGADGSFLVTGPPAGIYEVRIDDPAWAFHPEPPRVAVESGRARDLAAWFAVRRQPVRGSVRGEEGGPIRGASVRLVPEPGRRLPPGASAEGTAAVTTDARGAFTVPGVAPGEGYRLLASAPGRSPFVSAPFRVDRGEPTVLKPFPLRRGWRIELKLETLDGDPVGGATAVAASASRPSSFEDPLWAPTIRQASSSADGQLVLADLPEDDVLVHVHAPGFAPGRTVVAYPRVSDRRTAEIVLHRSHRLPGILTAPEGGAEGPFRITARRRDGGPARVTTAGADGRFVLADLVATSYDVLVDRVTAGGGEHLVTVEGVVPGSETELEIPLPATWALEGTVEALHLDDREPRAVFEIRVHDAERQSYVWRVAREAAVIRNHTQGRFRVAGLAPGAYTVRVVQGALDTGTASFVIEDGDVEGVALRMPGGARIAGAVRDEEGGALLGARVLLTRMHGDHPAALGATKPLVKRADERGDVVFEGLAPGWWRVEASDVERASDVRMVRVRDGEVLVLDDLVLGAGARLEGSVQDAEGRPLDGVHVLARRFDGDGEPHTLRSDAEGRFVARHLRAGAWTLTVDAATVAGGPWTEAVVELVAGESATVLFTAGEDGAIGGTVRLRGKPVVGAVLDLVHQTPGASGALRRYRAVTGVDGRFQVGNLAAGDYTLQVQSGAWRDTQAVQLLAGDELDLDLEAFEGRLRGEVVTRSGRGVGGARIVATPLDRDGRPFEAAGFFAEGRSDPRGAFVLRGLPPGPYLVTVSAAGLPPGRHDGAVADLPGADVPIEVVVGRGGDIALRVLDENDRGITGARVWIEDPRGVVLHDRPYVTGAAGRLRILGVAAGPVRVRVQARDLGRPALQPLTVEEGGVHPLRVRLLPAGAVELTVTGTGDDPLFRARIDILRAGTRELMARRLPLGPIRLAAPWGWAPRTGRVRIGDLEAGRYVARISAGRNYDLAEVPFEVQTGLTSELVVTLQAR